MVRLRLRWRLRTLIIAAAITGAVCGAIRALMSPEGDPVLSILLVSLAFLGLGKVALGLRSIFEALSGPEHPG